MSNQASTVPTNPTCPDCGTPLASGALAGMCPACLLKSGAAADSITQAGRVPFVPPTVEELAALFPALEILEFIGKGGMGAVYKARQRQLDRIVALKVLPPALGDDATFAERFAREARALAKLNHPGIVTLYEFGHVTQPTGPLFYILMEFVDGVNLRQLLSGGRISPREALAIVPQICDALQFAHDRGIVHRDIKPENLLIDRRGAVKVADFGLAKLVGNDGRAGSPLPDGDSPVDNGDHQAARPTNDLTDAGKVMGTPRYMAPEQSERPSEVDHRADIYALGVVFYQMLTGELPAKELRPPSTKVQIDVRLDEIVLRALERNPSQRYAAVSEMKTQVSSLVGPVRRDGETNAPESNLTESNGKQANLVFWILLLTLVGLGAYRGTLVGKDWFTLELPLAISTLLSLTAISLWWSFRKSDLDPGSRMPTTPSSQGKQVALPLARAALIFLGARGLVSSVFSLSMMASMVTGQASGASGFKLENFSGPSWIRSYLAGLPASTASMAIFSIVAGGILFWMITDLVALLGGWGLRSRRNYRLALTGTCLLLAKTCCTLAFRNPTPAAFNSTAVWLGLLVELWLLAILLRRRSWLNCPADAAPASKLASDAPPPRITTGKSRYVAALVVICWFAAFPFVAFAADSVRRPNALAIAACFMALLLPFLWLLAKRQVSSWMTDDAGRLWLRAFAGVGWTFALPAVGFAMFFFHAFLSERGGWNPAPSEALIVPTIFLAAILLPAAAMVLWGASGTSRRASLRMAIASSAATVALVLIFGGGTAVLNRADLRQARRPEDTAQANLKTRAVNQAQLNSGGSQMASRNTNRVPDFQLRRVLSAAETNIPADVFPAGPVGTLVRLERSVLIDGSSVRGALWQEFSTNTGTAILSVKLTSEAKLRYKEITRSNLKRDFATLIDGKLASVGTVLMESPDGNIPILAFRPDEKWDDLLVSLNVGAPTFPGLRFGRTNALVIPAQQANQQPLADFLSSLAGTNAVQEAILSRRPQATDSKVSMMPTYGLTIDRIGKDTWDRLTPEMARLHWELQDKRSFSGDWVVGNDLVGTYLFKSAQEIYGVVQVLGTTPDGSGVRIRYKLVEHGAPSRNSIPVPDFQIRRVLTDSETDLPADLLPEPRYQQILRVERTPLLDGSAIAGAFVEESIGKTNPPTIRVKLTADGSQKFQQLTRNNVNRRLAIMVNGKILSAPNITEEFKGGSFQIPGPRVKEERDALLKHLNSGSSEFSNLRFGKTNSLTITNSQRNQPAFLSLEWGLWATNPPAPTHTRRFQEWRRSNNVDLAGRYIEPGSSGANIPMVLTFSLTLADIGKDSWDRITPEMARLHWDLPDQLAKSMDSIVATESAGTYLFRTERDVFGVIEVQGATPDGSGVRIRYKLVEHGSQP